MILFSAFCFVCLSITTHVRQSGVSARSPIADFFDDDNVMLKPLVRGAVRMRFSPPNSPESFFESDPYAVDDNSLDYGNRPYNPSNRPTSEAVEANSVDYFVDGPPLRDKDFDFGVRVDNSKRASQNFDDHNDEEQNRNEQKVDSGDEYANNNKPRLDYAAAVNYDEPSRGEAAADPADESSLSVPDAVSTDRAVDRIHAHVQPTYKDSSDEQIAPDSLHSPPRNHEKERYSFAVVTPMRIDARNNVPKIPVLEANPPQDFEKNNNAYKESQKNETFANKDELSTTISDQSRFPVSEKTSTSKFQSPSFIQIIPHHSIKNDELEKSTLNLTYRSQIAGQRQQLQNEVLLLLKFAKDFDEWNPRNANSKWTWFGGNVGNVKTATRTAADNALFVVHASEKLHGRLLLPVSRISKETDEDYVELYSMPFSHYMQSANPYSAFSAFEGFVQSKRYWTVNRNQRFLARIKFACQVVNAEKHPFPAELVTKPWDDPRLGSCVLRLDDADDSGLFFSIAVTNKGIWATYGRRFLTPFAPNDARQFVTRRRVGKSPSFDTLVDAAIELDGIHKSVNYFLNGYKVWSVNNLGVPLSERDDDGATSVNLGVGGHAQLSLISAVRVSFGTEKSLDLSDPNNLADKTRLVRTTNFHNNQTNSFYAHSDVFWDQTGSKRYSAFGQGAVAKIIKLLLVRAELLPWHPVKLIARVPVHRPRPPPVQPAFRGPQENANSSPPQPTTTSSPSQRLQVVIDESLPARQQQPRPTSQYFSELLTKLLRGS